jgi:hypothetical protein
MFRHYRVILRKTVINSLPNAKLFHKLSHFYMFRHYRVILRKTVINSLPNAQLFNKLSHFYMFRHYGFVLRKLLINTMSSYTSNLNAAVGKTIYHEDVSYRFYVISHIIVFESRHYKIFKTLKLYCLQ